MIATPSVIVCVCGVMIAATRARRWIWMRSATSPDVGHVVAHQDHCEATIAQLLDRGGAPGWTPSRRARRSARRGSRPCCRRPPPARPRQPGVARPTATRRRPSCSGSSGSRAPAPPARRALAHALAGRACGTPSRARPGVAPRGRGTGWWRCRAPARRRASGTRSRCPASWASCGRWNEIGWPSSSIVPASGVNAPDRHFISVDLPAPLSPMTPSTSPR